MGNVHSELQNCCQPQRDGMVAAAPTVQRRDQHDQMEATNVEDIKMMKREMKKLQLQLEMQENKGNQEVERLKQEKEQVENELKTEKQNGRRLSDAVAEFFPSAFDEGAPSPLFVQRLGSSDLNTGEGSDVAILHSKFSQDPTFQSQMGKYGDMEVFDQGIGARVGNMDIPVLRGMFAEHCLKTEWADEEFLAPNARQHTTPRREWHFVVGTDGVDTKVWEWRQMTQPLTEGMDMANGRNVKSLDDLMMSKEAKKAGLLVEEVIGLRLYTGPMYYKYNMSLRFPDQFGPKFGSTITVIVSGLLKLCRITKPPKNNLVYRGFGGQVLPDNFFTKDEQGFSGGVELGFMSTTLSKSVALSYSGQSRGETLPTVFRIDMGKTSVAADVAWISQYSHEQERVFPPLTHIQVRGKPVVDEGVSVITLQPTVSQHFLTVEEALRTRKDAMIKLATSLTEDVLHWMQQAQVNECGEDLTHLEKRLMSIIDVHDTMWFNMNFKFQQGFNHLMEESEAARIELAEKIWTIGWEKVHRGHRDRGRELLKSAIECMCELCNDTKNRRDRIEEMRKELVDELLNRAGKSPHDRKASGTSPTMRFPTPLLSSTPGARAPVKAFRQKSFRSEMAELRKNLAMDLTDQGKYDEALVQLHEAMGLLKDKGDHVSVAELLAQIGLVHKNQGKYNQALAKYEESLSICREEIGIEDSISATTLNNMGVIFWRQAKYDQALQVYNEALEIRQRILGLEHSDVATTLACIALVYSDLGKYETALEKFEQSLAIKSKCEGTEHSDVASTLSNIGGIYFDQGKHQAAMTKYNQALAIRKKILGNTHPDVAQTIHRIGCVLDAQGKQDEAMIKYQEALDIRQKMLGREHPDVAQTLNRIGECYSRHGEFAKAIPYFEEALRTRRKTLGSEHPTVATTLCNKAKARKLMGDAREAQRLYSEAARIRKFVFGEDHHLFQQTKVAAHECGLALREDFLKSVS